MKHNEKMNQSNDFKLAKLKEFALMNNELVNGGRLKLTWIGTVSSDGHCLVDQYDTITGKEYCNFYTYDKGLTLGRMSVSGSNKDLMTGGSY